MKGGIRQATRDTSSSSKRKRMCKIPEMKRSLTQLRCWGKASMGKAQQAKWRVVGQNITELGNVYWFVIRM